MGFKERLKEKRAEANMTQAALRYGKDDSEL